MGRVVPILASLIAAVLAVAWSASGQGTPQPPSEHHWGGFSAEQIASIKQEMLELVNADRADEGLEPVERHELAEQTADAYAETALANRTVGHYSLDGLSPFARWGFMGGVDFVAENSCSWYWTGSDRTWTRDAVMEILREFEAQMLAEVPPNDGHRKTILNPAHTAVGMGLALDGTQLRYMQEFVTQQVELDEAPPAEAKRSEELTLSGKLLSPRAHRLDYVLVYWEGEPHELTRQECERRNVYGFPENRVVLRPMLPEGQYYLADRRRGEVETDEAKTRFRVRIPWFKGEGWYYVCALLAPRDAEAGTQQFPATMPMIRVAK